MNSMASEIRAAIGEKDSLHEICSGLITFFEEKGDETGLRYFKTVLKEMTPYDWVDEISPDFIDFETVSEERVSELVRLIDTLLEKQVKKRVTEETFYAELWERIWDDIVLPTHEDRTAFLQILWADFRIPYFQIDEGVSLSEEEFKSIVDKINPSLQKGQFIMYANIPNKTQRASLLIDVANGLDGDVERIVFWGVLIGSLRAEINTLLSMHSGEGPDDGQ